MRDRLAKLLGPAATIVFLFMAACSLPLTVTAQNPSSDSPGRVFAYSHEVRLAPGKQTEIPFEIPPAPQGADVVLVLKARLTSDRVAGYAPSLALQLNGKPLTADHLVARPRRALTRSGRIASLVAGSRFTVFYSPDFQSPDQHPSYGFVDGIRTCEFQFRVSRLVKPGENMLTVENRIDPRVDRELVIRDLAVEFRKLTVEQKSGRPAPRGVLPVIEPRSNWATNFQVESDTAQAVVTVRIGNVSYTVASRFSTPSGKWVTGSNEYFQHRREIKRLENALLVRDTLTNRTDRILPIMQRHAVTGSEAFERVFLAGIERPTREGLATEPTNPTSYGAGKSGGIGLLALSDVMRVHCESAAAKGTLSLSDKSFALKPNASYTVQWMMIPTATPDYWEFINVARRWLDVNFTIDGGFCFFRASPLTERWSDEQTRRFLVFKDVRYACASLGKYRGNYAHGTAFQRIDHGPYVRAFQRRRRLVPDVRHLVYFHCFLDVLDDSPDRFRDARILLPDGRQADYGQSHQRLFFPLQNNSYGPAISKNVDIILDKIGADGVYWDEHEYSAKRYHYGEPWDGVSCDIDRKKMTLVRLKSSVPLLTESWRVRLAKRILARGPLIGNGAPHTRAMAALKFPCFIETGSITNCTRAHLYSPIALGACAPESAEWKDADGTPIAARLVRRHHPPPTISRSGWGTRPRRWRGEAAHWSKRHRTNRRRLAEAGPCGRAARTRRTEPPDSAA